MTDNESIELRNLKEKSVEEYLLRTLRYDPYTGEITRKKTKAKAGSTRNTGYRSIGIRLSLIHI